METYKKRLDEYVRRLGVKDVIFTGKIPFDEILAYYKTADVFLCQSEHEGFCVPLIEAMHFDVPIIAYSNTAIPDTLDGAGVLLHEKDPLMTAGVINRLIADKNLNDEIVKGQRKRISELTYEKTSKLFFKYLNEFIGAKK